MAATKRVNGITIAIKADTNGVTSGLQELTDQSVALSKQLKAVDSLLKMNPSDTDSLTLKQELLAKSVETTKKRLEALKSAQEERIPAGAGIRQMSGEQKTGMTASENRSLKRIPTRPESFFSFCDKKCSVILNRVP